ncbi:MAG: hypothetical protein Sylvanvirus31_3 [Sylvanvirus sp.]|uniref:Uncharacterized protein n=1 Tax=Sylvanvirus sp. TaxID=2487774 RepID=A0A3G5AIX3_9VIRU|nr:MAG: hypothetical protein Sylvanvirus31_3 [Sylvanvirus sp.]
MSTSKFLQLSKGISKTVPAFLSILAQNENVAFQYNTGAEVQQPPEFSDIVTLMGSDQKQLYSKVFNEALRNYTSVTEMEMQGPKTDQRILRMFHIDPPTYEEKNEFFYILPTVDMTVQLMNDLPEAFEEAEKRRFERAQLHKPFLGGTQNSRKNYSRY